MAYTPQDWEDGVEGGTPINAARLTHMETGIDTADSLATTAGSDATAALASAATAASNAADALADAATATSLAGTAAADAAAAVAAAATKQPASADLDLVVARTLTTYGLDFLELANQAALMSLIQAASSTVAGKVELSTDAEAITGSSTTLAITPANLAAVKALLVGKNGTQIELTAATDALSLIEINDDGTSTAGWPNRFAISFDPVSGETIQVFVNNEYGELRLIAAKNNTVPFRVFERQFNTSAARNASTPLLHVVNNRSDDVTQWEVIAGGNQNMVGSLAVGADLSVGDDLTVTGDTTLGVVVNVDGKTLAEYIRDTIQTAMGTTRGLIYDDSGDTISADNVEWFATGSEPSWSGHQDCYIVEYTP